MSYSFTTLLVVVALLCATATVFAQSSDPSGPVATGTDQVINVPSGWISHIGNKMTGLDQQLTDQTDKMLQKMARREERMKRKLWKVDSAAAKQLFGNSAAQYSAFAQKMQTDTGTRNTRLKGDYLANTDSLHITLAFLQQQPQLIAPANAGNGLNATAGEFQTLQAKMEDADEIKQYVRDQREQIGQYLSQHAAAASVLGKDYQGMNQDLYYYSQRVRSYKEELNDPDKLTQDVLAQLKGLPAFQTFAKNNSQLAGLFNLPGNYGSEQGLTGLQTRDQVGQIIQDQVAAGGGGGASALQGNLQSAESQLDGYKDKLSQLGAGGGDIDLPNFKPNDQKTKTFWKRLEYGANFQTTRNTTFYPTVTDLGLSMGYRLGHSNTIGLGASYKIGWGNGWNHIAFSSEGVGLRSFVDIKLKGSFFISGGFEYNYTTPMVSLQQIYHLSDWTKSGLIGISKTVSVKNRVFKKTKLSLLWDFLSYQQVPKTQPLVFRIGYSF